MGFQVGDVVMYMGYACFVIDANDDIELLILTDGVSTTSDVDYEDVVKIGHDDAFEQNIVDRLKSVKMNHDQELLDNQKDLIDHLKATCFYKDGITHLVTGKVKLDGNCLYCQIKCENRYEWLLVEELLGRFFK